MWRCQSCASLVLHEVRPESIISLTSRDTAGTIKVNMNCTQCGQPLVSGAQFCGSCGTPVPNAQPAATQVAAAPVVAPVAAAPVSQAPVAPVTTAVAPTPVAAAPPPVAATPAVPTVTPVQAAPVTGATAPQTNDLAKKQKWLSTLSIILGIIYLLGSTIIYLGIYNNSQDATVFVYMPIDIILGLAMIIPGIQLRSATDPKKIMNLATSVMGAVLIVIVLSLLGGKSAGLLLILLGYFAVATRNEAKKLIP